MTYQDFSELYEAILKLKTEDECAAFFEDLCTVKEIEAMNQRVKSAKMLLDGKTYTEIMANTEISSATLSRVSKCVQYGTGYKTVLKK